MLTEQERIAHGETIGVDPGSWWDGGAVKEALIEEWSFDWHGVNGAGHDLVYRPIDTNCSISIGTPYYSIGGSSGLREHGYGFWRGLPVAAAAAVKRRFVTRDEVLAMFARAQKDYTDDNPYVDDIIATFENEMR